MKNKLLIATLFLLVISLIRIIPHPNNFSPVLPIALFSGSVIFNRFFKFLIPFVVIFITDSLLNVFVYNIGLFYDGWYMQYLVYVSIVVIGMMVKNQQAKSVVAGSLVSSILFFIVSNFVVWIGASLIYAPTFSGLMQCYTAGLPFFSNGILGDLLFNGVLFGSYYLVFEKNIFSKVIKA